MHVHARTRGRPAWVVGREPICNRRPDRAPHIGTFCFPLCWRCTGVLVGIVLWQALGVMVGRSHPVLAAVLVLPCALDGLAQYHDLLQSTNLRRFGTGLLAGVGFCLL